MEITFMFLVYFFREIPPFDRGILKNLQSNHIDFS
jgi:hypothetical protein